MDFEFSFGWMLTGLAITAAGGAIVVFYRQISDHLVNRVSSYSRVKLFGIITILVGLAVTANLHVLILTLLVNLVMKR